MPCTASDQPMSHLNPETIECPHHEVRCMTFTLGALRNGNCSAVQVVVVEEVVVVVVVVVVVIAVVVVVVAETAAVVVVVVDVVVIVVVLVASKILKMKFQKILIIEEMIDFKLTLGTFVAE
ncbi:hypothetical protein ElyMa_000722900 [Elysia marginata]|uniref:Uncharacterized protein n=1 Tax=Elysia marginata TaxID=1093978 RepID=A0AAV4GLE8_9GAST|nr:hypothetical protein ElyMa_000722900 [Elysia marginata]